MAVEDIPPKRPTGLGERLSDVLARQTLGTYGTYEEALFGGEGTATPEEVEESRTYVTAEEELPPPEYVNSLKFIRQSSKSDRPVKRPDLYPEFYGDAPAGSTRVAGMQWIPTSSAGAVSAGIDVMGDLVVAFARPSRSSGNQFYVYEKITRSRWESIQSSGSYGKTVGSLTAYHVLSDIDITRYKSLHSKTDGGLPWSDWLFEIADFGRSGELNYSDTWSEGAAAIARAGRASSKKAKELSKKTREQARKDRQEGIARWGNRTVSLDYNPEDRNDY